MVAADQPNPVPPPRAGDALTRDEFERRCDAMPTGTRAELIDGVVHNVTLGTGPALGRSRFKLVGLLGTYDSATPGVVGAADTSIRLGSCSVARPAACLFVDPALGGRVRIEPDDYISGGPELVVDVAASTAGYDANQKLEAYRRNAVGEYILWRTRDRQVDHFVLRDERFEPVPSDRGVIRSFSFPGLWLDTAALIAQDLTAAFAELRRGLASPEHAAFAADLAARAAATGRPRP